MLIFVCHSLDKQSLAMKDQLSVSSSPSAVASPRPGLSRANSINFSADSDDSFTGLTLLDALVVLDSHLDLARRQISRKGQEWKSRAESTAISVKRQAEEVLNQRRTRRRVVTGSSEHHSDRIDIDRELAKFKHNVRKTTTQSSWEQFRCYVYPARIPLIELNKYVLFRFKQG